MYKVVTIEEKQIIKPLNNKLNNLQFCFTGPIIQIDNNGERYTRNMMHNTVLQNGGTFIDKVNKATILVQADPNLNSSKYQKAKKESNTIYKIPASPAGRQNTRYKIISAWRYPGVSPKRDPIPEEILRELNLG